MKAKLNETKIMDTSLSHLKTTWVRLPYPPFFILKTAYIINQPPHKQYLKGKSVVYIKGQSQLNRKTKQQNTTKVKKKLLTIALKACYYPCEQVQTLY